MSNSDVIPLHLAKGIVVYSIFKWIASTLPDENSNAFSYQLAKQHDEKILKHIRKYIISKLCVPDVNIPLFIHAIGVLDAFQMLRCFSNMKLLHYRYKFVVDYFKRKRLRKYFHTFCSCIQKEKRLREVYRILFFYSSHKCVKSVFDNWRESFHLHYVWNNFVYPKLLKKHFYYFSSRVQAHTFQRQLLNQIVQFCSLKQKRLRWNKWLFRLSKIANIQKLTNSQTLKNWILSFIKLDSSWKMTKGYFGESQQFLTFYRDEEQHKSNAFAYSRVMKIAVINERSVLCQRFFLTIGILFWKVRSFCYAIWRWKWFCSKSKFFRRIPNTKIDYSKHENIVMSRNDFQNVQKCSYYLKKWCRSAMRSSFLNYVSMKTSAQHTSVTLCNIFRQWLVASAASQMLRRRAHQIFVIKSNDSLKRHFLLWRETYKKASMDKINQRHMIELRERQAEMYLSLFKDRREQKLKIVTFRNWVKYTRLLKYGQYIFQLRMKYHIGYNERLLKFFWQHWKTVTSECTIVDCIKAMWLGFKCRHISHSSAWKYQYLKWYKRQIPKIFYLRKKYCKQRVFLALWKFAQNQKQLHKTLLISFNQKTVIRKLWKNLQFLKRMNVALQSIRTILSVQIMKNCLYKLQTLASRRKLMRNLANECKLKQYFHFMYKLRLINHQFETISISKRHRNHRLKLKYFMKNWYRFLKKRTHSHGCYKLVIFRRKLKLWTQWRYSFDCHQVATFHSKRRQILLSKQLLHLWIHRHFAQKRFGSNGNLHCRRFMKQTFFCRWIHFVARKEKHNNRWITLYKRLYPGEKKIRADAAQAIVNRSKYKGVVRSVLSNVYNRSTNLDGNNTYSMSTKFSLGLRCLLFYKRWKVYISSRKLFRRKVSRGYSHWKHTVLKIGRVHFRHWLHYIVKKKLRASKERRISQMFIYTLYVRSYQRWKALRRLKSRIRFVLYKKYPIQFPRKYFRIKCSAALQKLKDRVNRKKKKFLGISFPQKSYSNNNITRADNSNQNQLRVIRKLKIRMQHFIAALQLLIHKKKHPQRKVQRKIILKREFNSFLHNFIKWKKFVKKLRVKKMINYYSIVHYQNNCRFYVLKKWFAWTRIRVKFYKIRKRFYVVPIFDKWLKNTVSHFQNRRIVDTIQSRINFRMKRQILVVWKIFTNQSKQISSKYFALQRKHIKAMKQTYLNAWMVQLDVKILQIKYEKVQRLNKRKMLINVLRNWYKLSLLNDIITWKNTKKGLLHWKQLSRTWHKQHLRSYQADRHYLRRNLNLFLQKLKFFVNLHINVMENAVSHKYLDREKKISRVHRSNLSQIQPKKQHMVFFSASNCAQLNMKRCIGKWKR